MRKRLLMVLLIVLCATVVFAGGQADSGAEADEAPTGTIRFANVWGGSRIPLMDALIASFNEKYPDIEVISELVSQAGLNERYLTSIASGNPPDVIMINRNQLPFFASQNALASLDDKLAGDGMILEELYYKTEIELCKFDGTTYALPNSSATGFALIFWNKKMFADAGLDPDKGPETWADLSQMNEALLKTEGGKIRQLGLPPAHLANEFINIFLAGNNGFIFSKDNKKVIINSVEAKETLTWMIGELERVGGLEKLSEFYEYAAPTAAVDQGDVISNQAARLAFYNQKTALQIEGVWSFGQMTSEPPEPIDYGVCLIPYNSSNPDAKHTSLVDGGWAYAIPKGAPNEAAAWEFLKFATGEDGAKPFFMAQSGRPTALKTANADPAFSEMNAYWDVVVADAENSTFIAPLPVSGEIKQIINDEVEKVIYGRSSVESALDTAQAAAQKVLDSYWAEN